ncbi:MAG TPA: WXG100 family type VII secretion target [Trebonia sp.]|jgi:WXG100 family type VII secretion target
MSDGLISVNYGPTNDVYDALMHADSAIGQVLSELENVINPLIGTWEGISSDAWQSIQKGWSDMIVQMNQDLSNNAGILSEMTSNYSTTDNNLALQWQDISLS